MRITAVLLIVIHFGCIFSFRYPITSNTRGWKRFVLNSNSDNDIPKNVYSEAREGREVIPGLLQMLGMFMVPKITNAITSSSTSKSKFLDDSRFKRGLLNLPNELIDDFWLNPFLIGRWNTTMKFKGANFTNLIPLETLAKNDNVPGFSKYSIIFAPDIGKDIRNMTFRFVQIDGHPRYDHPFNIRSLITSFLPDAVVDSAPYSFQKAPDWFHSPANKWTVKYHDSTGEGVVQLFTVKRLLNIFAGTVETSEFIRQIHTRKAYAPITNNTSSNSSSSSKKSNSSSTSTSTTRTFKGNPKVTYSDYTINWKFFSEASLRDEFITLEDLRKSRRLFGEMNVLVYFQPSNDLYFKLPGAPVGVYSYDMVLDRIGDEFQETENTVYPFVWRDVGPIELDKYFGY